MPISPTAEGFRAAFRRPSLTLAEIIWRWVVGTTATVLFFFGMVEYLDTLPITGGELLFLKSGQPVLVAEALAHIVRGSLARAALSILVAATLLSILWMVAAALGRAATVNALLAYFRSRAAWRLAGDPGPSDETGESRLRSSVIPLFRLNFLRVALLLAVLLALAAANIFAGYASPDSSPRPALAFLVFFPLASLILLAGWALNWLLSLGSVFAARDGSDAIDSILSAVPLCRDRAGAVFAVSAWTAACHAIIFVIATTAASTVLGFAPLLKLRLAILLAAPVTLAYFAVADWIYMARLAGYICILEMPAQFSAPPAPAPVEPPVPSTIDRDELILSDVPGLVPSS